MTVCKPIAIVALAWTLAVPVPAATNLYQLIPNSASSRPVAFGRAFSSGKSYRFVATDSSGNVYVADSGVRKITPDGNISPVAGFGPSSYSQYGIVTLVSSDRTAALLASPVVPPLAADSQGNLFLAGRQIYRVTPDGMIEIYAPLSAMSIAADSAGNLYALGGAGTEIFKIAPDRSVRTVAGTGVAGFSGDGGLAVSAQINAWSLAVDAAGNLFIADAPNGRIRKVDAAGVITTVAQEIAYALAADGKGNVYFSQQSPSPNVVKKLSPNGLVAIYAGGGVAASYWGDGGLATAASLVSPSGLAVDAAGNLYIADGRLRKVDAAGIIHTVAGCSCFGDGVPVSWAQAGTSITGIVRDSAGATYFSDRGTHMVRRIAPDGAITTFAGNGESGFTGDGGLASQARLSAPAGLALDANGNLYIADEQNNRIRKVSPAGIIQTVAGSGVAGFGGDGKAATSALFAQPDGVVVDTAGNLYIADTGNHRIRKVTTDGIVHTIAGSDAFGFTGDGGPAAQALLINPRMLALDKGGGLLFTDSAAHTVRRIGPGGFIERVAGTGQAGTGGNGGVAVAAQLDLPWAIGVDDAGDVLIGEGQTVRMVDPSGIIQKFADVFAYGLATDHSGNIWFAAGSTVTVASSGGPPFPMGPVIDNDGVASAATFQTAAVAPGEIVSIFGTRLGPDTGVSTPAGALVVDIALAGVRVFAGGIPAPLLYVQAGQINAVIPYGVAVGSTVDVTVEYQGLTSNAATVAVLPAVPGLFEKLVGTFTTAAAVNQNQTINGPGNQAAVGSVVSLYATGAGQTNPAGVDGRVTGVLLPRPVLPVTVSIGARLLEVQYAGAAPGFVSGALQVNVKLPSDLVAGYYPLELRVGDAISGTALVWTRLP